MLRCPECDEELDEENAEFECPFCGEWDDGEGYLECPNCGMLLTIDGDEWICEYCDNEGKKDKVEYAREQEREVFICPECGAEMDDDGYCDYCGWPNNQGWIGENC